MTGPDPRRSQHLGHLPRRSFGCQTTVAIAADLDPTGLAPPGRLHHFPGCTTVREDDAVTSPGTPSAPDGTTGPGGAPPPANPVPSETGRAPERTFTDNWRRLWRRRPDMGHAPADLRQAFALNLAALVLGAIMGAVLVLLIPSTPPTLVLMLTLSPAGQLHLQGVRHRWWALGAGLAAGVSAGLGINALLPPGVGAGWATLTGILVGSGIGAMTHAAVTHLPTRDMPRLRPKQRACASSEHSGHTRRRRPRQPPRRPHCRPRPARRPGTWPPPPY